MAGVLGFEPRMAVPKTAALPLGYTPKIFFKINIEFLYSFSENTPIIFVFFS